MPTTERRTSSWQAFSAGTLATWCGGCGRVTKTPRGDNFAYRFDSTGAKLVRCRKCRLRSDKARRSRAGR